jgi:hypothetical protein
MKRTIAYLATAIILGLAVVMLPRTLELQHLTADTETSDARNLIPQTYGGETSEKGIPGLASQPMNLLPMALILLSGIVAAAAVAAIFRRRMATQQPI